MRIQITMLTGLLMLTWYANALGAEFTVSTDKAYDDTNPGDGVCSTGYTIPDNCTLRAAIQEANALAGPDRIVFDRPLDLPSPNLPEISDGLTIDGSSQWTMDTNGPHPVVEIGSGEFVICGDDVVVTGLMFFGTGPSVFDAGIRVEGGNNIRIGGPGNNERNVFVTTTRGILVDNHRGGIGDKVTIQYNYFGVIHKYGGAYGNDDEYYSEYGIDVYHYQGPTNEVLIEHNLIGECRWHFPVRGT
jgi:CSLREA domain-containing protein